MVALAKNLIDGARAAPQEWKLPSLGEDARLHQIAPYIGKLKPSIARYLLSRFTSPGDVVLDCFSGSGTIPLEALILGRRVLAFDSNPYAVTLTRAKLEAPSSSDAAFSRLMMRIAEAEGRPRYCESKIPGWVAKFFHPETLQNAIRFADACLESDDHFLLACLLSILHHQRPGFLSYPSSHLVPYLRDRKYPRDLYSSLYEERLLLPRLEAKIKRLYKNCISVDRACVLEIGRLNIADMMLGLQVDAIVTSPPYMNALDYVRDNRLRMWFLDKSTEDYSPEPTETSPQSDAITASFSRNALRHLRRGGYCVLVVGETVLRKRVTTHPAERIFGKLAADYPSLILEQVIHDEIPDVRRSRRTVGAIKRELVLVLRMG